MSGHLRPRPFQQPASFVFSAENRARAEAIVKRYPPGRQTSAVMPLLDLAQRQHGGWLPRAAMDHVAALLEMAPIRVYEVATFYSMYRLSPVGKHVLHVCTTTPCWLRGSEAVVDACRKTLGIGFGETTEDGAFTLLEVECLGACVNAPVLQINEDYFEDVTPQRAQELIEELRRGGQPAAGSQIGRRGSAPEGGPTTLKATTAQADND
jgi:NADH-quinone oxidoreductase E subunit